MCLALSVFPAPLSPLTTMAWSSQPVMAPRYACSATA